MEWKINEVRLGRIAPLGPTEVPSGIDKQPATGPVVLTASTHLALNAPNALVQESVRAFYRTWYRDLLTALPEVRDGMITIPPGAGLGTELNPEIDRAFTTRRRVSDASDI